MTINQLAVAKTEDLMTIAQTFTASGMFPDGKDKAKVATKLLIGQSMGLNPLDSMTGLNMIQGKVVLAANLMASSIKRNPKYDYRATSTDTECSIDFYDVSQGMAKIGTTTFTIEDAQRAGIAGGANWRKYPRAMLFARAISAGYREHCPDALGTAGPVYVQEHGESEIPELKKASHVIADAQEKQPPPQYADQVTDEARATIEEFLAENPYCSHSFITNVFPTHSPEMWMLELNKPRGGEDGLEPGVRDTVHAIAFEDITALAIEAMSTMSAVEGKLAPSGNSIARLTDQLVFKELTLLGKPEPDKKYDRDPNEPPF
tara:strand:+ start:983 stop:1936 length:954 start_codon:yes stop_codon:yes gene_type:complete